MSLQYHKEKLEENIEGIKGQAAEFKKTYFDEDTEWNEGLGKKAWYPLKKIGELSDHVNDQISLRNQLQIEKGRDLLPGQTWDDAILDYSFKDLRDHTAGGVGNVAGFVTGGNEQVNDAFELGAQILLPDVGDFATGGLGYVDNLGRAAKQLRKFDANDANKLFDQVLNARRFGGELTKLKNSAVQKVEEVKDAVMAPINTVKGLVRGDLFDIGAGIRTGGGNIPTGYGSIHVPPNASQVYKQTQKLLNENVLIGPDRVFDYGAFRALFTGSKRGRTLEGWMQTTPHFKISNWDRHRQEMVDVFESIYGDIMQLKSIPRKRIHIDHLVTLRSSMPVYDGVAWGSPLWNRIQETFLNRPNRYNPGNTLANLDALDPGSHTVKTNFFNKRIGKDGELFFTPEKLEYMKVSEANRMEVLNEFLDIQDEGTLILREAKAVWESLYKVDSTEMPIDIYNRLSQIPIGEFSHPELKNLDELKEIITDIITDEASKSSKGMKNLIEAVEDTAELDDYSGGVRQVIQDTDPELLPKPTRVISKKGQLQKQLTKEDTPINPDQTDLGL